MDPCTHTTLVITLIWIRGKILKQAKGNECNQYKCAGAIFSSSLPICPIHIFSSDTHGCFALVTSYNTTCFEKLAPVLHYFRNKEFIFLFKGYLWIFSSIWYQIIQQVIIPLLQKKLPCPDLLMTRKFLLTCNFFSDDKSKFWVFYKLLSMKMVILVKVEL